MPTATEKKTKQEGEPSGRVLRSRVVGGESPGNETLTPKGKVTVLIDRTDHNAVNQYIKEMEATFTKEELDSMVPDPDKLYLSGTILLLWRRHCRIIHRAGGTPTWKEMLGFLRRFLVFYDDRKKSPKEMAPFTVEALHFEMIPLYHQALSKLRPWSMVAEKVDYSKYQG
jgi:hypothetical protein